MDKTTPNPHPLIQEEVLDAWIEAVRQSPELGNDIPEEKSYAPACFESLTKEEIEKVENQSSQSKSSSERSSMEENSKKRQLTEEQKWECVARWINTCYLSLDEETEFVIPCANCPYFEETCRVGRMGICPASNFKVIEQFTGKGTIVSPLINLNKGTLLM